jgi:hypothetical protein
MQRGALILVTLLSLISPALNVAQSSSMSTWIEPAETLLPVGQAQTFQLLGSDGNEQTAAGWALSDSDVATFSRCAGPANNGVEPGLGPSRNFNTASPMSVR